MSNIYKEATLMGADLREANLQGVDLNTVIFPSLEMSPEIILERIRESRIQKLNLLDKIKLFFGMEVIK
jgi:uncharacterized protein YjbI with pentapeptide repeats